MPKHCYYDKIWKRYRVQKVISGKTIGYGSYATEEEAMKVINELIKKDWNREELPGILEKLDINSRLRK